MITKLGRNCLKKLSQERNQIFLRNVHVDDDFKNILITDKEITLVMLAKMIIMIK